MVKVPAASGVTGSGKKKRRAAHHKAKRIRWRRRAFEHVQARRRRHAIQSPNDLESLARARRWLSVK